MRAEPAGGGDGGRGDDGAEPVIQCMKWGLVPNRQDREARPFQDGMYSLMNWLLNRHTVCVLKPELVAVEQIFPLFKVSL